MTFNFNNIILCSGSHLISKLNINHLLNTLGYLQTFVAIGIRWQLIEQWETRASYWEKRADPENRQRTMNSETQYLWKWKSNVHKHTLKVFSCWQQQQTSVNTRRVEMWWTQLNVGLKLEPIVAMFRYQLKYHWLTRLKGKWIIITENSQMEKILRDFRSPKCWEFLVEIHSRTKSPERKRITFCVEFSTQAESKGLTKH